jgi:hypothetical protein
MDMKRKFIGIVGALALATTMTGGIASAQETLPVTVPPAGSTISLVVNCGAANAGTGSVTLNAAGGAEQVAFENFDPSNPTTVSTAQKAFRVDLDLGSCAGTGWSVTAGITDFTGVENPSNTIAGSHFQLPIGEPNSSAGWTTNGSTPATNVTGPAGIVTFSQSGSTNVANQALAVPNGAASGAMSMEFTGQMFGLDDTVADDTYEAEFTVTFNPSNV